MYLIKAITTYNDYEKITSRIRLGAFKKYTMLVIN